MNPVSVDSLPLVAEELAVRSELVPLAGLDIIELGCGDAKMVRKLLGLYPDCRVTALEVDAIQHARNVSGPQAGLTFVPAGAEAVPCPDASFDLALMLKSLHHVPVAAMATALQEVARVVLRPGGLFYASEPIYDGALNEIVRLFNDEGTVRAAAQAALDDALSSIGVWEAVTERRFALPVSYRSFDEFEQRMMRPTYADHKIDAAKVTEVRTAFDPHRGPGGAALVRPIHVRLLRRTGA
jgi:ubiquinone/menaquinone biosynthesis C-methylase UbiE